MQLKFLHPKVWFRDLLQVLSPGCPCMRRIVWVGRPKRSPCRFMVLHVLPSMHTKRCPASVAIMDRFLEMTNDASFSILMQATLALYPQAPLPPASSTVSPCRVTPEWPHHTSKRLMPTDEKLPSPSRCLLQAELAPPALSSHS